jgi:hypothetical protein
MGMVICGDIIGRDLRTLVVTRLQRVILFVVTP